MCVLCLVVKNFSNALCIQCACGYYGKVYGNNYDFNALLFSVGCVSQNGKHFTMRSKQSRTVNCCTIRFTRIYFANIPKRNGDNTALSSVLSKNPQSRASSNYKHPTKRVCLVWFIVLHALQIGTYIFQHKKNRPLCSTRINDRKTAATHNTMVPCVHVHTLRILGVR